MIIMDKKEPITTEKTSKKWKRLQIIGCLPILLALLLIIVFGPLNSEHWFRPVFCILLILAGLCIIGAAKLGAWWENG